MCDRRWYNTKSNGIYAPKIIGGTSAPSPVGDLGLTAMTEALELEQITTRTIDSDLLIEGYMRSQLK